MSRIVAFFLAFGITSSYANNVHLRGRIFHPLSDSVKIFYYFPSIAYHPVEQIIPLDKSGKFEYSFDVPHGYSNIAVTNGDQTTELFVSPGSDLQMTVDASHFDSTVHYEGNGKEIANFMAKHTLERHMLSEFNFEGQKFACTESPNGFLKDLDALENSEIKFLLDNKASLPPSFVHYLTIYFRYSKYDMMEMYPRQHEMCRQRKNIIKHIPPEDYTVIDNIPLAYNDSFIDNPGYIGFLTNILFVKAMADSAKTSHDSLSYPPGDTIEAIAYRTMPRKTAEYYLGSHLVQQVSSYSPERVNQKFETYKAHFPESPNLVLLKEAIMIKNTISIGKIAPDFDIVTPEGLRMKLSDLRGKVVYLDFWSSGCIPCIAEMPFAKKLHTYFKNKPVEFVSVSLDPDKETWKEAIKHFDVAGINSDETEAYKSEVVKKYGVDGTPSYYLIDKNGKFAEIESLARPSDGDKLKVQIENLLN